MKTLSQELQEILDNRRLKHSFGSLHICNFLSNENLDTFDEYFEMSKKYATEFHGFDINYDTGWWKLPMDKTNLEYVLSEKYRFIQDLIKILP